MTKEESRLAESLARKKHWKLEKSRLGAENSLVKLRTHEEVQPFNSSGWKFCSHVIVLSFSSVASLTTDSNSWSDTAPATS